MTFAALAIFAATYLVLAIGKLPGYQLDRAGAALLGGKTIYLNRAGCRLVGLEPGKGAGLPIAAFPAGAVGAQAARGNLPGHPGRREKLDRRSATAQHANRSADRRHDEHFRRAASHDRQSAVLRRRDA
jgi:hypothetical protein